MRQTAGVIERKTLRQNRKTGVSSQQNRVSAREAHALPHSALNIPRTNRETRRMGNALVDAIFHNEEKAEPIFPPARPNAKRRIAAQTSPRAHKRRAARPPRALAPFVSRRHPLTAFRARRLYRAPSAADQQHG